MTGAAVLGLSWEQFLELLDQDAYKNAEQIDGEVVVNTPDWLHQRIATNLLYAIGAWIRAGPGRGEVTFNPAVRITHNRGNLPDVSWYREERFGATGSDRRPEARPISPWRSCPPAPGRTTWCASAPTTPWWASASCG